MNYKYDLQNEYESNLLCISIDAYKEKGTLYEISKRTIDIVGAIFGVILLLPIFLIVAIILKIESPGSEVIFKQKRCGKDGKEFEMYKFRSMVKNADELLEQLKDENEQSGPVFKMKDDPRVTKIGKYLRKTSIDELPQLINVLKGDMSLVGPRPPLINEVKEYNLYQMQRLSIDPGITCIWQVNGRSSVSFEEWVEMDLEYIRSRSVLLDIKLIFKTIFVLFGDKNAY